jgi:hypothetical protein
MPPPAGAAASAPPAHAPQPAGASIDSGSPRAASAPEAPAVPSLADRLALLRTGGGGGASAKPT